MNTGLPEKELTELVIGLAMKVHRVLGAGFVEFVYRSALLHELRKAGLTVEVERPMKVRYEGIVVGEFSVDLFINGFLVVELKAVAALHAEHESADRELPYSARTRIRAAHQFWRHQPSIQTQAPASDQSSQSRSPSLTPTIQ